MSPEKDPKQAPVDPVREPASPNPKAEREPAPPKLDYQFKIVRADPKNGFDFEDVADK